MSTRVVAAPLLTVAPTQRELGGLGEGDGRTRASVVGIGREAGQEVGRLLDGLLMEAGVCRALVSLGYAGGLDPRLQPGDLVVGNGYRYGARPARAGDAAAGRGAALLRASGLAVTEGAVLTVDEPLLTGRAKRRARQGSGALVVDMEGRWIADAAAARGVPLIGIRAVLDEADFSLPPFIATIIADGGRHERTHAIRALSQPAAARSFLPLALRSRRASGALQAAVDSLLPGILDALDTTLPSDLGGDMGDGP